MEKIVRIQLKDTCYYEKDFEYNAFIVNAEYYVIKDNNFEEKFERLKEICENYDTFQEVEDFIEDNFKQITIEEITIEI